MQKDAVDTAAWRELTRLAAQPPSITDLFANDPFERFRAAGGLTSGKGDWAWLQHTLA